MSTDVESSGDEAESTGEGEEVDFVLATFIEAIATAILDTQGVDANRAVKRHLAVFVRAGLAQGGVYSKAKAITFAVLRCGTEKRRYH